MVVELWLGTYELKDKKRGGVPLASYLLSTISYIFSIKYQEIS